MEARAAKDEATYEKEDIYDRPDVAQERVFLELKRKAELYELRKKLGADVDEESGASGPAEDELVDFVQKRHDDVVQVLQWSFDCLIAKASKTPPPLSQNNDNAESGDAITKSLEVRLASFIKCRRTFDRFFPLGFGLG